MSDSQPVYRDRDDARLVPRTERPLGFHGHYRDRK